MVQPMDRAAFLAALQSAAAPTLKPAHLPGVGDCWQRQVTAGDVIDAEEARESLTAAGLTITRKVNVAIGLAQAFCDESGNPLLDPHNPDHIRLLIAQPWDVLKGALGVVKPVKEDGINPNA
jgi:hypothetical protein